MRAKTVNYSPRPQDCFPYAALPGRYLQQNETPEEALNRILASLQDLYSEGKWQMDRALAWGSDEAKTAAFFNMIVGSAGGPPPNNKWRSHEAKMVEHHRKPDVLLVSAADAEESQNHFSSILSYCEVKKTQDPNNHGNVRNQFLKAEEQLMDIANCVASVQRGRRYFVGLALCNSELIVTMFIRGCTICTTSIDINAEPLAFLNIILTVTDASPTWIGLDARFDSKHHTVTLDNRVFDIVRTLFRSLGVGGRGTVVFLCKAKKKSDGGEDRFYILKESWVHANWLNDVYIYSIMNNATLEPLTAEEEEIFGSTDKHEVFKHCVPVPLEAEWDYESKLPGIPIVELTQIAHCDNPSYSDIRDGRYQERICEDTTANILARMPSTDPDADIRFEHRVHESILYRSIGLPITRFSCRRELLNGMLGILSALRNGIRKGVLHCDLSQNNMMFRVAKLDMEDIIPDWPQVDGSSYPGRCGYVKRAGLLADWGLALKHSPVQSELDEHRADGWVTGTFPFIATELLTKQGLEGRVAHKPHHDLESLFWVLWCISINYVGPYGRQRTWLAHNGQVFTGTSFPHSSSLLSPITFLSASQTGRRSAQSSGRESGSVVASGNSRQGSAHRSQSGRRRRSRHNSGSAAAVGTAPSTPTTAATFIDVAARINTTPATPSLPTPAKLTSTTCEPKEVKPGRNRYAEDDTTALAPVWATPEPHRETFHDVFAWRVNCAGSKSLLRSITPYFRDGRGGKEFIRGISELAKRFEWQYDPFLNKDIPPEKPITHQEFFNILVRMRDAIDHNDRPSPEDIEYGRLAFERQIKIQVDNFEHVKSASPVPAQEPQPSSGSGSKRGREGQEPGGSQANGLKRARHASQSQEGEVKRS